MIKIQDQKIHDDQIRKLVIERLKVLPSGKQISVGSDGSFNKEELIAHVEKQDSIGQKISQAQIEFLQSLKTGILFDE
ncbi:MAG: hypothetical protein WAP74_03835 [Patescibacteria group bacterium]